MLPIFAILLSHHAEKLLLGHFPARSPDLGLKIPEKSEKMPHTSRSLNAALDQHHAPGHGVRRDTPFRDLFDLGFRLGMLRAPCPLRTPAKLFIGHRRVPGFRSLSRGSFWPEHRRGPATGIRAPGQRTRSGPPKTLADLRAVLTALPACVVRNYFLRASHTRKPAVAIVHTAV